MKQLTIGLDNINGYLSRRGFMKSGVGLGLILGMSMFSFGQGTGSYKIVVVGGGFGGATVAKYLKLWGRESVDVTLVESNLVYSSDILNSLVLTNQLEIDRLDFDYNQLSYVHGVNIVHDHVVSIDSENKTVSLDGGAELHYNRLVLSPGIDFVDIDGWNPEKLPHAWSGREQTELLRNQLEMFPYKGTFVLRVPSLPYRCPPAPYERASSIADYLRKNGKGARVIVLDSQPDISVSPDMFKSIYEELGVEYRSNIEVISVNSGDYEGKGRSITFADSGGEEETIEASVINLIPDNKASQLIFSTGLADPLTEKWALVNPLTYESKVVEKIHILGDSQATAQPKAGQMANAQAKVCADAILRLLAEEEPYPHPITTAGCFAPVTHSKVNWMGQSWRYNDVSEKMEIDVAQTTLEPSEENWEPMLKWASNLFADTFG